VLDLINRSGSDLVPRADSAEGRKIDLHEQSGSLTLTAGTTAAVAEISRGPAMIRAWEFSAPRAQALAFGARACGHLGSREGAID